MQFKIDVEMSYRVGVDQDVLLAIEAAELPNQTILSSEMAAEDADIIRIPGESRIGQRAWLKTKSEVINLKYTSDVSISRPISKLEDLRSLPISVVPFDVLSYIRPSRYCQSDMFRQFTKRRFGQLEGGQKIGAIRDWIRTEIEYLPGSSDDKTTVLETFATRAGVCRDFAHMVCALARAANIPARYVSAYGLGVNPPDFHAVVQVYLDGEWHLIDPSGMCEPDQIVIIGVGRDAVDIPFMETENWADLIHQKVEVTLAK